MQFLCQVISVKYVKKYGRKGSVRHAVYPICIKTMQNALHFGLRRR